MVSNTPSEKVWDGIGHVWNPQQEQNVYGLSLATFYLVIIGGEVDASICESTFPRIHYAAKSNAINNVVKPNRKVSIFRLG